MSSPRPERLLGLLAALAIGAAVVIAVALLGSPPSAAGPSEAGGIGPPDGSVTGTVVHVTDGDTIVVELGGTTERVRYIGLDAPEIAHPEDGTAAECWGDEAQAANAARVDDREVALERDVSDRDRFGRLLRHVWVRGDAGWYLVGKALIEAGDVEARSYRPDTTRDDAFDGAERRARAAGIGLWGSC